jgi:hypothetical protein
MDLLLELISGPQMMQHEELCKVEVAVFALCKSGLDFPDRIYVCRCSRLV